MGNEWRKENSVLRAHDVLSVVRHHMMTSSSSSIMKDYVRSFNGSIEKIGGEVEEPAKQRFLLA